MLYVYTYRLKSGAEGRLEVLWVLGVRPWSSKLEACEDTPVRGRRRDDIVWAGKLGKTCVRTLKGEQDHKHWSNKRRYCR